ncbi:DUF6169 family protein [Pseudozobellia sp. WGM2]|uniref:DUF6169 family protein n=1 Tax=Pseudozobellia sp. WGM2 TaxID=2787625 RepID=UPI001ADF859A|nr:DUF6169 family protein [Pseudozobellia sp. WGM2]
MYDYKLVEGTSYPLFYFITSNGYEYSVSFFKEPTKIKDVIVVQVSIDCINSEDAPKDLCTGKTVFQIILNYLKENDHILAFVCDDQDSRHLSRKRKFTAWYKLYNTSKYDMLNYENYVQEVSKTYYSSVIYNTDKYSKEHIETNYNKHVRSINSKD